MLRFVRGATIVALAWGALAFGAVYPWAYIPLAIACAAIGAFGMAAGRLQNPPSPGLAAALVTLLCAIGLQLVPISPEALAALSPGAPELLRTIDVGFALGLDPRHPLSIHPASTLRALMLGAAFILFLLGLASAVSMTGPRWLASRLAMLGVLMALIGIIRKPLDAGEIYGFWKPLADEARPFGSFVNKNHFAGWMLMSLPVAVTLLISNVTKGVRGMPTMRDRVLWLGSKEGSLQVLLGLSVVIMGLSLVLTMSRSGIAAAGLGAIIAALLVIRGGGSRATKAAVLVSLAMLVAVTLAWAGTDRIAGRFNAANQDTINARRGAWADAWRIATLFPLTGTGLNTYSLANTVYQRHQPEVHYAQAHNDYLQLAAEGGALVVIPVALAALVLMRDIRRRFGQDARGTTAWWLRAGSVVGLVAIAAQESVEFSLQMPGNAALFAALCAIAIHEPRARVKS